MSYPRTFPFLSVDGGEKLADLTADAEYSGND